MKRTKLRKPSEREIQKQVIEWLRYQRNIYFMRNNTGSFRITRKDGSVGWCVNGKRGSPDIILCKGGEFIGLEIKTQYGRVSCEQRQAEKDIKQAGGKYFVIRSLEEAIKLIK
jgi:hypothetical protein